MKTNELQQLTSILGTDSLLADTADAGTGRLTLARAAEFFGGELIKPTNPVGTALSQKADLSVQEKVELTGVAYREVHITAVELPTYIAALPRLLTEDLAIYVTGGTITEMLSLHGFYGSGKISVIREGDVPLILTKGVYMRACRIPIILNGLTFQGERVDSNSPNSSNDAYVVAYNSLQVQLNGCTINGSNIDGINVGRGVAAIAGSSVVVSECTLQNLSNAVLSEASSCVSVDNCTCAGNLVGAQVYGGGLILLSRTTPDLLGGSTNEKQGGLIAKSNGTLL